MKLTLLAATLSLIGYATATYSANLETIYGYMCKPHAQMEKQSDGTAVATLYTDNSIFQLVTGYALGTQVDQNVTDSTCFGQAW